MEDIINEYVLAFDELNTLSADLISELDGIDDMTEKIDKAKDDILSFLISSYLLGHEHSTRMLNASAEVNRDAMYNAIFLVIAGENFEDRIATHLQSGDMTALQKLIEDEYHRDYCAGAEDAAKDISKRYTVFKTWLTMEDNKVRDTHWFLQSMSVGINEKFVTYDGDSAYKPGGFERAENNCGCRCILMYSRL
ncbi:MAG: hypothetical protein IJ740_18925 [Ruminococcus sp.]|nr:hypothetical protein [Ruminococcus sp.]MBR1752916.1 hypothetical protein [Ruminococcus sp.]